MICLVMPGEIDYNLAKILHKSVLIVYIAIAS